MLRSAFRTIHFLRGGNELFAGGRSLAVAMGSDAGWVVVFPTKLFLPP
jgi:hypothetical protein